VNLDRDTWILILGTSGVLIAGTLVAAMLRHTRGKQNPRIIQNLVVRVRAWWGIVGVFAIALVAGRGGVCTLFAIISFLSLRELLTLAPTRLGDHHTLFWAFFVIIPLQYYIVYIGWYTFFTIFIPVWCFIFLALRSTLAGDTKRYLERTAKVQWGVMICVYFLSHAPALLMLPTDGDVEPWKMLVFLVIVVQMSDVLQYIWGMLLGKHKIAPHISPNKTWEGFIGGVLCATVLGAAIRFLTPFRFAQSIYISFTIAVMGFFGGIVMSAIKRDAGIKDFGHLIEGHGGMLDRVDSLVFAAPVFFHVVRYWYT
jgi:phosphatidate cytidylyltransferase